MTESSAEVKTEPSTAKEKAAKPFARPGCTPTISTHSSISLDKTPTHTHVASPVTYVGPRISPCSRSETPALQDVVLFLLPCLTQSDFYAQIDVLVPRSKLLLYAGNLSLRLGAVWGTEIYSDDSDIVAACVHAGYYKPADAQNWNDKKIAGGSGANHTTYPIIPDSAIFFDNEGVVSEMLPDHDLRVKLIVLPRLAKYTGSLQHGIKSRTWSGPGQHDGESFRIISCEQVPSTSSPGKTSSIGVASSVGSPSRKRHKGVAGAAVPPDAAVHLVSSGSLDSDFSFKYSRSELYDWPFHIKNALEKTDENALEQIFSPASWFLDKHVSVSGKAVSGTSGLKERIERSGISGWPFWRVKMLLGSIMRFEDEFGVKMSGDDILVTPPDSGEVKTVKADWVEFTVDGLQIKGGLSVKIVKYLWK
ncbi:MAG: hypothetical protein SGCHY_001246 [Lobulomycetales sp.]